MFKCKYTLNVASAMCYLITDYSPKINVVVQVTSNCRPSNSLGRQCCKAMVENQIDNRISHQDIV